MAQSELSITLRDGVGKNVARQLRRQELIPAVIYGKGTDPCSVAVSPRDLDSAIATDAGWNTLLTLKGDGPFEGKVVILKALQKDPLKGDMLHADFHTVDMTQRVHVMVPVHVVGTSAGEKMGGSLQIVRHELEVNCLPADIPSSIHVDVTALNIGEVLHIADIQLPAGVEVPHDVNFTVVTVVGHKAEAEVTPEDEAAAAE